MKSRITSFLHLFDVADGERSVERVEIPLIQRDYAQGRADAKATRVRTAFVDVLHSAVNGEGPVGLDFVYGELHDGTLRPLDGQQRLTTLYLLHWYVGSRAGAVDEEHAWKQFSYATRTSARMFCERLVQHPLPDPLPPGLDSPSDWVKDQAWYLFVWRHDPTVQAMLVMLDAIHERFAGIDAEAGWARLAQLEDPAVSFHLLPIEEMGSAEDLYIKMNSRGKPLTDFETFKARFERMLEDAGSPRAAELAMKIDGVWSDVVWHYHGGDNVVDQELMRYIDFITEICQWRQRLPVSGDLESRARAVFGPGNDSASDNLDFLLSCFDTWVEVDVDAAFRAMFSDEDGDGGVKGHDRIHGSVLLFEPDTNLLSACFARFGRRREFTYTQSLLLYAVLLHRTHQTDDFGRRVRIVRNLASASEDEFRPANMPGLVADVERIVLEGDLDNVSTFNRVQVEDEREKRGFIEMHPHLESSLSMLEDHRLLRGSLVAFALDPETFSSRAQAFERVMAAPDLWPDLTGALLSVGDYSRRRGSRLHRFGSPEVARWWRELLTGASRKSLLPTADVLADVLDRLSGSIGTPADELREIQSAWTTRREAERRFDWRYYLVRYPAMREGRSGMYAAEDGEMGYSVCMLDKTQMNSYYRDAYLHAVCGESGTGGAVGNQLFTGYETEARWVRLESSGTQSYCVDEGFALEPPISKEHQAAFEQVCSRHGVGADHLLVVHQEHVDGLLVDAVDRIQVGAGLVADLVAAGL